MKTTRIQSIATYAVLVALAFILGWLESLIPNPLEAFAPGIKLGLANLVTMISLYMLGIPAAIAVSLIRILLTAFTFGNLSMMFYSLSGAALSLILMITIKKTGLFSPAAVSMTGGIAHNIGQVLLAMLILSDNLFYYLPFLLLGGIAGGLIIGLLTVWILPRLPRALSSRNAPHKP